MANSRILFAGLAVMVLGGVFAFDSFNKTGWNHTDAKVMSIDTECEMKSTEYGVLSRTTSSATIDCDLTDAFQNLHADKNWTVTKKYTAHVLVGLGTEKPAATTMSVASGVVPGQILKVVQNPKSATRVQLASAIGNGLLVGAAMIVGGALVALLGFAMKSQKQKAIAMLQAMAAQAQSMAAGAPATQGSPAAAAPSSAPPAGMMMKRAAYTVPASQQQAPRRAFGRR